MTDPHPLRPCPLPIPSDPRQSRGLRETIVAVAAVLGLGVWPTVVGAFSPPVDTAGPLTVRIEGPEEVTQTGAPLPVRVVLQNKGEARTEGTVRLGLIDCWRAEPDGPVQFAVDAGGTATLDFKVTAGEGTYSAHYPIHAYARFQDGGEQLVAHPILVLETKLPSRPPARSSLKWKPIRVPEAGQLGLWHVPVHRSILQVFGEGAKTMPIGWQGTDPRTGGSAQIVQKTLGGQTREAFTIHPPWHRGLVGTLLREYPLQLPKSTPVRLQFAAAVRPEGEGDGVTFRVRVLPLDGPEGKFGRVVFEQHIDARQWKDVEVDLGELAGQAVRLQLESHPGPKNDTGWDQSFWAEPTLVTGDVPDPLPFPPKDDADSIELGTIGQGDDQYTVRLWPGRRGVLDAVVGFRKGDKRLYFHGFEVRVLGGRIDDPRSPLILREAEQDPLLPGYQVRHRFESPWGAFDLVGGACVERGVLRAMFRLENAPQPQPWLVVYLEDVAAGQWSRKVHQVYAGHGNVIRDPRTFGLAFEGHRLATSFVGFDFEGGPSLVQGVDVPPTHLQVEPARRHYSLHVPHASKLTFIPAENVWEGVKAWRDANGLEAAGGVRKVAGRFVFDLWGGRYAESAESLRRAFRYGLTDSLVVWHNWQRWGYDYRLPNLYPPNPNFGTLGEMQGLIRLCKNAGVLIAPHDNYIDFYPDADGFSYERNIAFHHSRTPVKAWIHEARGAQSYRYRADRIADFMEPNLRLIRDGLRPNAFFIDVWSSIRPYDYWTADGKLHTAVFTRNTWGRHFSWIRELLGDDAPQISESGHDQLIGHLDGAQTNHLRVDKPMPGKRGWCVWDWQCADAERTPWFDAAHHDRFILHGAGYSSRYQGGLDGRLHGIYSDDYMATEVLTGHPAMVSAPLGRDVVRKYWLLHGLMRALALKRIEGVGFVGDDLHRQHVRWSGGGEVWVNRGKSDWDVGETVLPEYGFTARVPTDVGLVEASISRRDGVIVETARSPAQLYVNGRGMVDRPLPIRLVVQELKYEQGRKFRMKLQWQADVPIPAGWSPFLHFCDEQGEIIFQAGHHPGRFDSAQEGTISAPAWCEVPAGISAGKTFELRIGIYNASGGARLRLAGPDDGTRRIRLGSIHLDGDGGQLTGVSWTPGQFRPDPFLSRRNPQEKPIDFGSVITAGGCRLMLDGEAVVITPLPDGPKLTVAVRWGALPWKLPAPTHVETLAEDGNVLSRRVVCGDDGITTVECERGVFAYRLLRR